MVGSISGIIAFGSGVGGTLFTNLTGQVVQHYSYSTIFVMTGQPIYQLPGGKYRRKFRLTRALVAARQKR